MPARGATAQLELPNGQMVEAVVVDIDGVSEIPRARVTISGTTQPLMVPVLAPGVARESLGGGDAEEGGAAGNASLLQDLTEEWAATVQDFREKGAVCAVRDATLDAVDMVGSTAKTAVES